MNAMYSKPDLSLLLNLDVLQQTVLFQNLSESALEQIFRMARLKKIQQGEFFFLQGDPAECIYLLLQGHLKLTQCSADGQQMVLRMIGTGTMFGAIAIAQTAVYPINAEATEECTAAFWHKSQIIELAHEYPQLALNVAQIMAQHVQEAQERYLQMATERVERRLARTLLRLANQAGVKTAQGIRIDLSLTRQDLAEMCGTTLYTVSRTLRQWEAQGLVSCGRTRVVICKPHGLVCIAEDLPATSI